MKLGWLFVAGFLALLGSLIPLGLVLLASDPASARSRHRTPPQCHARPAEFSWSGFWGNRAPVPNGCAPAVFAADGTYIGQDPDPNIRTQLRRDPNTGYSPYH